MIYLVVLFMSFIQSVAFYIAGTTTGSLTGAKISMMIEKLIGAKV